MISFEDRILILDGAMGTMIQRYGLTEEDYHASSFAECRKELIGNNECLNLTRAALIKEIHKKYIDAGADIIETNTFSANSISQSEYGCEGFADEMAYQGARLAREVADMSERKVWVAGSMGPTSKSLSLSPDASDPTFRPYSFEELKIAYRNQAEALIRGGVDMILLETCFDALNVKAALAGIQEAGQKDFPVIVSVSVGDRSGRTLTGQTLEAFYTSVRHYPLLAFGLNCSLGASDLMPLIEEVNSWCSCAISCYPNAGLPNEMGGYDQSPADMAAQVREMGVRGLVNIVGGCCGTTPDHIRAIAAALKGMPPREIRYADEAEVLKVSGLEAVSVDVSINNFINVGERTNVAGSRKFARLISEGKYDQALQIAARQIEDGASIIDINMDDAMLDSTREMERFLRCISNDPDVSRAALMIDSSHWDTIVAGLQNAQGKCIVNSISLKEGPEAFIEKARIIRSYGAAVVVMAFDEEGQATSFDRKIEICSRAYRLLTEKVGMAASDIIFDVNILSIGTGMDEHSRYAIDFIEAVRWIKENLPGALTSGGVSNLSFAFRGNNPVREAMHSAFLYHAIKAGLDMAIVNPSMLQVYDEIEPELLKCVEDVIFNTDPQATERLTAKAEKLLAAREAGQVQENVVDLRSVSERIKEALVKGHTENLEEDLLEALKEYGSAVNIIEGPLMEGMEKVGELFGNGKMFLPQVVKSAKVMRDAVGILEPYIDTADSCSKGSQKQKVVLATVKGDVHDIGKNITGIVLTCNGFEVHDLGVMVDRETILEEAARVEADIIAVSGLITPSLYQMEEICREMHSRGMSTPLFIGGATTTALHTAVKLAPLYEHVFHGADASAAAVMAKKCMMDRETFETEQHTQQDKLRQLYYSEKNDTGCPSSEDTTDREPAFGFETYLTDSLADIPVCELQASEVLPFFDWKMFYAIWGVKYGGAVPEAVELMQLRRDAEDEIAMGDFRIMLTARFFMGGSTGTDCIRFEADGVEKTFPMFRQEDGKGMSLCDYVISSESGRKSPFGVFAVSVHKKSKVHVHGCSCPACSNHYEDMVGRTVRMTLAEAASAWLDSLLLQRCNEPSATKATPHPLKIIKPAAGYASCPDHTLKGDILKLLCGHTLMHSEETDGSCCHSNETSAGNPCIGIELTESYAMVPESSICGFIFIHPNAIYPEIRRISRSRYEDYAERRGMDAENARRFIGHLLK